MNSLVRQGIKTPQCNLLIISRPRETFSLDSSLETFSCWQIINSSAGSKQSYGEPQNLTEIVREALKDKKPIAEKSTSEPPQQAVDEKETTTETRKEAKSKIWEKLH